MLLLLPLFWLALCVFYVVSMWKVYTKAGQPGWACLIPIYHLYILLKIARRPGWWLLLFLIPIAGIVIGIMMTIDIAKAFGKGTGFAVGLIFLAPIFYAILAFDDTAVYAPNSSPPPLAN